MPIIEVRVLPVGTDHASISSFISASARVLVERGIHHQVTPTGTVFESDLESGLTAAAAMHREVFARGAHRVVTQILIDERSDKDLSMDSMVAAVQPEAALYAGIGETFA